MSECVALLIDFNEKHVIDFEGNKSKQTISHRKIEQQWKIGND